MTLANRSDRSLTLLALRATLHCLAGCAVGEVLGMVLGTAFGLANGATMVLSIGLAFAFGWAFTVVPLLRSGLGVRAAFALALAADTASIALMEVVDNAFMALVPGAMDAPLDSALFWASLAGSLVLAGLAAWPLNRWLMKRGRGHALAHAGHAAAPHGGHDTDPAHDAHSHHAGHAAALIVALALTAAAPGARAQGFQVDQQNIADWDGGWSVALLGPVGQTFFPALDQMNVVVALLGTEGGPPQSGAFAVRVWADSIGGTLLGTSDTLTLPAPSWAQVRFDFARPVPLVPGRETTFEVFRADGDANLLIWGNSLPADDVRAAILAGRRQPRIALWFQTGFDSALPVMPTSWGAIKARWR